MLSFFFPFFFFSSIRVLNSGFYRGQLMVLKQTEKQTKKISLHILLRKQIERIHFQFHFQFRFQFQFHSHPHSHFHLNMNVFFFLR